MAKKDGNQTDKLDYQSKPFFDLFALVELFSSSIRPSGFRIPASISKALVFSRYGRKKCSALKKKFPHATEADIRLVLLLDRYHQELYFSPQESDLEQVKNCLSELINGGQLRYPWIFGATLYRRASELFPTITDTLDPSAVDKLLAGAPQGVFQMRSYVTGPFGILESQQMRDMPPTNVVPLWHCDDAECSDVHTANLSSHPSGLYEIFDALRELNAPEELVQWRIAYTQNDEDAEYYSATYPGSFPILLGNGFSHGELKAIIRGLLDTPKGLREIIQSTQLRKRFQEGSEKAASELNIAQCLQLALLCKDKIIIEVIEKLIASGQIYIPTSETRGATLERGWFRIQAEASINGIRTTARQQGLASTRLRTLLLQLFPEGNESALAWRVRNLPGKVLQEKLDNFIEKTSPHQVIRSEILSSAHSFEKACEIIGGFYELPENEQAELAVIDKFMWKLGYDIPQFPINYKDLEYHASLLKSISTNPDIHWHDNESQIRGHGANYFVALEGFLNDALSFSHWALTEDHYKTTKFRFNLREAHLLLSKNLAGKSQPSNPEREIRFDPNGKNTLGTLVQGFRLLSDYCQEMLLKPNVVLRDRKEFPRYAGHTALTDFPFMHRKLFPDLSEASRRAIIEALGGVTTALWGIGVPNIRNRLEHSRSDFPAAGEIASLVDSVRTVMDNLIKIGLCPITYYIQEKNHDEWGRERMVYRNYRGDQVTLPFRSHLLLATLPEAPKFAILTPGIRITHTHDMLRFSLLEDSDYSEIWKDYPIRGSSKQNSPDGMD